MHNYVNDAIFFGGPIIFSAICPKKPLFSGLGEAGGVNFGCRGGKMRFPMIFEILHKTKILKFSQNGRGLTTILGNPTKTGPIHDPRGGKNWNPAK